MALRDRMPFLSGDVPTVPVVRIGGVIAAGGGRFRSGVSIERLDGALSQAFAVKRAPAVALVINSPGGSPVQSHLIFRRIRALSEESDKPVIAFVEDVAASGGYMIALAADEIVVDLSSVIGSIGVVAAGFGLEKLIDRIGVERRVYTSGTRKVMLDPFLPEKAEDVAHLEELQRDIHEMFIGLVRSRRRTLSDDPDLFSGAFWTGRRGIELGLADRLGDLNTVLRERFGSKVRLKPIATEKRGLLRRLGMAALAEPAIGAIMSAVEEQALWGRYGL